MCVRRGVEEVDKFFWCGQYNNYFNRNYYYTDCKHTTLQEEGEGVWEGVCVGGGGSWRGKVFSGQETHTSSILMIG